MRYSLTLPFAAVALIAVPAIAQDTAPQTDPATTQAPLSEPPTPDSTTPPVDPTTDTPPAPAPTPVDPTPSADPMDNIPSTPATPGAPQMADPRAAYDAWPAETKAYYDALPPNRQQLFLRIADADKARLVAMPADQQGAVWISLERQAADQDAATPGAN